MRLLHTGDWHVGRTLFRRSRLDESAAVLREVFDIGVDGKVDGVLVCGDVFDHHAPSPESEQVVYEGLVRFKEAGIPVILLAGNHDNPRRWQALRPLFEAFDVTVVPDVRRPDEGGIVELSSRDGSESMQVACLPWVGERRVVGAAELMGLAGEEYQNYAAELSRLIEALCQPFDATKSRVFAGHLFVSGAATGTSERQLTIGDLFAIAPQALPSGANYVALGHVHRPQRIRGASVPARYAGSLLQLDFGETGQQKAVCVVDMDPRRPAAVEEVALTSGRTLQDLHGTLERACTPGRRCWRRLLPRLPGLRTPAGWPRRSGTRVAPEHGRGPARVRPSRRRGPHRRPQATHPQRAVEPLPDREARRGC